MKKWISLLLAMMMLLSIAVPTFAEEAAPAIVDVKAIGETLEEGATVTGVRMEYPGAVAAGTVTLSTYAVSGYSVIGIYVNDSGIPDDAAATGKYVFVKLAHSTVPGYSAGKILQYTGGINHQRDIFLEIRQNSDVTLVDGTVIGAAAFTNNGTINVLADDFIPITYTNPDDGTTVDYRLFIPEGYDVKAEGQEPLPLVLFLHGSGESGYNNISQILGNPSALEFATAEAQAKNPCFIVAAQKPNSVSHGWAEQTGTDDAPYYEASYVLDNLKLAIDGLLADYSIDASRLYCTGLSMGGRGTMAMNVDYPDMFAAMLVVASCDVYTDDQLTPIKDKPIWVIVAADESESRMVNMAGLVDQLEKLGVKSVRRVGDEAWNGYSRGFAAEMEAKEQIDAAIADGATLLYTHYIAGTVQPSSHWSWMATYNNAVIRDWMFAQKLDTPYAP